MVKGELEGSAYSGRSTFGEVESEDFREHELITIAEVHKVDKNTWRQGASSQITFALRCSGYCVAVIVNISLQCHVQDWDNTCRVAKLDGGTNFYKGGL